MFKTIKIIVMAALCLNFSLKAQEPIKPPPLKSQGLIGKIISATTGEALPGAVIKITNTNQTLLSNDQGEFMLSLPNGNYNLSVSYLNHKTKNLNIQVPLKEQLVITLKVDDNPLNEVQIIGYGQTTKRLNTGSISSITATDIEKQPVTNVLSALSGRMPGVFVQTTNGLPGGNINIQIRGKGSISAGTTPLYIIDGVPYDGNAPIPSNDFTVINNIAGSYSPLNNLNPADIETITILKDADATAIYGSRGANGVVLITTKKASAGNTKLEINLEQGLSKIAERPKLLNLAQYLEIRKTAFANDNLIPSSDPLSPNYAPDLTVWSQTQSTNWVDHLFGNTAGSTDLQARIATGKDNTTFSVSGNYRKEDTVLPGENNYLRTGLNLQLQHHSENDKFHISASSQLTHQFNDLSNLANSASYLLAPNYPLRLPGGTLNWYSGTNPDAEIYARSKAYTDNSITSLHVNYRVLHNLTAKIDAGYTKTAYNQKQIFPARAVAPGTMNYAQYGNNSLQSAIFEPQINYTLKTTKSSVSILAGATFQKRVNELVQIQASNFKLESLMEDLASAGTIDYRSSAYSQYKYASVFGRITYNLMDSYILNATIRRDGSSRFGPGNRFGNFGSVGGAWIFSNLNFVKNNLAFISYGKLRASYGTVGNDQIGDYQYLSTYNSPGSNIYQGVATVQPSRISNDNFHWETTRKTDLAIEMGFVKDKIVLSANYYINKSKDQLIYYSVAQITGFSEYQANLPAVVKNSGWEFTISADILRKQKFSWTSSFNITLPKNILQSFEDFKNSSYSSEYELGYDITRMYGYKALGIDQATGKIQYAGENGKTSDSPYFNFTLGKLTPDYYGGFSNTLNFKDLELSVFAQFVRQVTRGHGLFTGPGTSASNNYAFVRNNGKPSTYAYDFYYPNSSLNVFNTSYIRLKNVSLAYTVPAGFTEKLNLKNLKLYVQGQNLFSIWDRNSAVLDPESGPLAAGASRNFPPLKSFLFGIKLIL